MIIFWKSAGQSNHLRWVTHGWDPIIRNPQIYWNDLTCRSCTKVIVPVMTASITCAIRTQQCTVRYAQHSFGVNSNYYHQVSNISRTLVGNTIVDHSDVVGASPVGAAPTTSSFSTWRLASLDWEKTTARQDEKDLSLAIWCLLY